MKKRKIQATIGVVTAVACVLGWSPLLGCKHANEAAKPPQAAASSDATHVTITPELRPSIVIGQPQQLMVTAEQQAAARVQTDASRIARIGSPVDGRITRVLVYEGQHVRKGDVLAMLHTNALSDTQFAFVKACSQQKLAEQSAERARQLVAADVIGKAELQKREAEVLQVVTEVAALRAQLHGLGMSESSIQSLENSRKLNSDYPILATISGTVIERKVTVGQVVQSADVAFQVADLSHLWLMAEVPEEQAGALHPGKHVVATVPAIPGQPLHGKLSFVSPIVNPETRTVQARMDLENNQHLFKPDMLATMTFESRPENKLTVPTTAVVREDNKDYVFVSLGNDAFALRAVELGAEAHDRRIVLRGLSAGETIVLDGAFHLNNKRKQDQIKGEQ